MKSPDRRSSPANDVSASVSFPSGVSRATILFERSDFMISVEMQKKRRDSRLRPEPSSDLEAEESQRF